ncbi:hypothetical protein Glove_99g109 [Diversispora epigaea]|uniref:Uncharacterized protein n=1 Tax=Diversispora epigaea TaxID=1348612 RepID=A0A397J514_9GLOM|nr:hypothetical protein Glove_99g109 [Diversispora epigaea]
MIYGENVIQDEKNLILFKKTLFSLQSSTISSSESEHEKESGIHLTKQLQTNDKETNENITKPSLTEEQLKNCRHPLGN